MLREIIIECISYGKERRGIMDQKLPPCVTTTESSRKKMQNNHKRAFFKKSLIFSFLFCVAFFAFADRYSYMELFAQTFNVIKNNYVKKIKVETLVYGAIKGLLREVDPHSHFLLPEDFENLKKQKKGEFYGLGIEIYKKGDFLIVVSVVKDSPAEKAGFQQGDQLLKIDKKLVRHFNKNELDDFFKKNRKKVYKITVLRKALKDPLIFTVYPKNLTVPSIFFQEIQKGFFYLKIFYFSNRTLFKINTFLEGKTIKAMILDLRGNPGGIFEQAVKITDLFLNEGLIAQYKIRTEEKEKKFLAHHSDTLGTFPLAVLIDEYSASASEVVAGALKDHKRAILIGRRTFGKGSIQNVFHLKNNHALKLTVGGYQTPSGELIHNKGIEPDILLKKKSKISKTKTSSRKAIFKDLEIYQAFQILKQKL